MNQIDRLSNAGRGLAALVATVSFAALALQYVLLVRLTLDTVGPLHATVKFFSYFTILSNLLVTAVCTTAAFDGDRNPPGWFARPAVRAGVALYIGVTGIIYVTILRHLWQPQGAQWWADTGLHYATPLLYGLWWLWAPGHGRVLWRDIASWLWFPLAYLLWTLLRGTWAGEYPYPFIDVGALGLVTALRNAAAMMALFVVAGVMLVGIDRGLGRARLRRAGA